MSTTSARPVVIITGAGRGLGRTFAASVSEVASGLILVGRDPEALEATVAECHGDAEIRTIVADMTDEDTPERVMALAQDAFGAADVLVNNAGIVEYGPFVETSREFVRRMFEIDVESVYFMTQEFARTRIAAGGGGLVVNLGTIHAMAGVAGTSAYAAAKGAIHALTRTLAVELAPHNIRVNNLALGMTMTERVEKRLSPALKEGRMRQIPLKRGASPEEAASALRYLLTAEYMTGSELVLDGGFTIYGDGQI